jgi:sugar lactone lactonase YvrE
MSLVEVAARRENLLGEGPCWEPRAGRLFWVDIKSQRLEWLSPADGATGAWDLPAMPTAAAPRADGTLVISTEQGVGVFDPATGTLDIRIHPDAEREGNRSNDGGVDMQGRFWFGTMDDDGAKLSGAVYRVETDWSFTRVLDGLGIPNTVAVSPDGYTIYIADSFHQTLYAHDLDPRTGALGYRHILADTRGTLGTPDGSAVDAEGFIWNAQWGASRVVRYSPDGEVDRIVEMPVSQPTKCAFGGADLSTLFITSARRGLSPEQLDAEPLAGSLFSMDPGVRGLALPPFGG